jgi:hypothetical protein
VALVRLTLANTPFDADMIQSLLKTEGIESTRRQTNFGAGSSDGWGGQQEILVEEKDVEAGRALISQDAG